MAPHEHRLEAFEEYYGITPARATTAVAKYLRGRGLNAADMEDVTQETLLSMVKKLSQPDRQEVRDGTAWAVDTAKKRLKDFWRKKSRTPNPQEDMDTVSDSATIDDTSQIDDDMVAVANQVFAALGLTSRRRQVADMLWNPDQLDFNAVPQAFVAEELGIALGTVKSTLSAVKAQFRAALAARLGR